MKLVTAIVRSEKLDELIGTVIDHHGQGLTVTEVRGFGRQFGELAARAADAALEAGLPYGAGAVLLRKIRLDILVHDEDAAPMAEAIAKHARTGVIGDGKIWVSDVHSAMRIRTGEQGPDAV